MITPAYVQRMAAYNRWMNEGIYDACAALSDEQRKEDRGAFFRSLHGTLNHILWGDRVWMHRLAGTPRPEADGIPGSVSQHESFKELRHERAAFDTVIEEWAAGVDERWLGKTRDWYSGSMKRDMTSPNWLLVTHMFNHQTHHRGQVHCLLTGFGVDTPTTDLPFAP